MAAWNAAFIIAGLLLIALVGEMYQRLTNPFTEEIEPYQFVDRVGIIRRSNTEMRANFDVDKWNVSRVNSLGFLDSEPVSAERAADSCHIAFIGDSFVDAREVAIADKFHRQLEDMAARELPHLDITTQAYGIINTGQINQITFYDEYARHMTPNVVALVFYINDFSNNSTPLQSIILGMDPDRMPYMSAQRDERGALKLRPPDPNYLSFNFPTQPPSQEDGAWDRFVGVSRAAEWLDTKGQTLADNGGRPLEAWAAMIAERPCCALLDGWQPADGHTLYRQFMEERLHPVLEEALEYTAFAIEQFKRRADRDGAKLIILAATDEMGTQGDPQFDRLIDISETYGIPVISQYNYIANQGYDYSIARWRSDVHWSVTGHRWMAEAFFEWLQENLHVCDD